MNRKKALIFTSLLFFICISHTNKINAQVTIGSGAGPESGAIIDLKERLSNNGGANSDKGLVLPRVKLVHSTIPTGKSLAQTIDGTMATENWDKNAHIGLMVYATSIFDMDKCPGPYVWNGNEWQYLISKKEEVEPSFTDGEGNTYTYKKFGSLYWMTQNVRSVTKKGLGVENISKSGNLQNKGPLLNNAKQERNSNPLNIGIEVTKEKLADPTLLATNISYTMNGETITQTFKSFYDTFGLMYNYKQAKEACPEGWRIPSKAEWFESGLEAELQKLTGSNNTSPLKYPAINFSEKEKTPIAWNSYRKNLCEELDPSKEIGFNALPSGAMIDNHIVWQFGQGAYFWTSWGGTTDLSSRVAINPDSTTPLGYSDNTSGYNTSVGYALRCVRETAP